MKIRKMTRCAMLAALLSVCAWISVPVGHGAVSLQTFGLFLTLGILGGKLGSAAVLVYLLLGAVGLPVFSGFRGGIGVLLGPTGGYLWGFLAACCVYWILETYVPHWISMLLGQLCCYACGTAWYYFTYTSEGLWPLLMSCVMPYLIPDVIKILLALAVCKKLKQYLSITIPSVE